MLFRTTAGIAVMFIAAGCRPSERKPAAPPTAATSAFPPMPNFTTPVDYVAWYVSRNFSEGAPIADEVYARCCDIAEPEKSLNKQLTQAATGPWSADDMPELAAFLDSIGDYLDSYEVATNMADVRWDLSPMRDEGMFTIPGPPRAAFRTLGRATAAEAWRRAGGAAVDPIALLSAWRTNLRCANHLDRRFGTGHCLYAMALRHITYRAIGKSVELNILGRENLKDVLRLIVSVPRPSIDEAFRTEAMFLFDFLQRLYPNGRFSVAAAKSMGQSENFPAQGIFMPRPGETAEKVAEYYRPIIDAAAGDLSLAALKVMEGLEDRRQKIAGENIILCCYLPSLKASYRLALRNEMERRGAAVVVALSIYHEEEGRWPASLDGLRGVLPNPMLIDPYSSGAFVYRVENGVPQLYSVAFDGADDGGKHSNHADRKRGCDYVFLPNPEE